MGGARQQRRYASLLEARSRALAQRRIVPRPFSPAYPDVFVSHCEHHYIFYLHPEGQKLRIFAVFHEYMDILARLAAKGQKTDSQRAEQIDLSGPTHGLQRFNSDRFGKWSCGGVLSGVLVLLSEL